MPTMYARLLLLLFLSAACSKSEAPKNAEPTKSAESGDNAEPAKKAEPKAASGLSAAKQKELKEVLLALTEASPEMHSSFAAMALAEIEADRLPKPLLETLKAITQAEPSMRAMLISKGLAESIAQVQTMCEGSAIDMMQTMAEQAPETRLALIREECKTDRFNLVSDPSANTDAIAYLLAHVLLSHLEENGGASDDEKALIRYLATAQTPASPY